MSETEPLDGYKEVEAGVGTDLIDLGKLGEWMDSQGLASGPITDAEALPGGTQNLLLRFRRADRTYILRRGPRHLRRLSNDVMRREARVLQALAGSDVPHPRFVAGPGEPGTGVAGDAVFYLMDPVDGFNPASGLSPQLADRPDAGRQIGLHMADAIAALGAVDHVAVGLADLGKPGNFLERQVPRWLGELDSYAELEGYPGPEIPHLDEVASWLEANRPAEWRPGILHGDFHLSNVMIANDRPEVAAIVDWEMCTIGDPLLDLGNMLGTWPIGPDGDTTGFGGVGGSVPGLPTPAEVVARYAEHSDRDTSASGWYTALACFKLGIVLEGTHARAYAGKAPKPVGDLLHATTLGLFARAHTVIAKG